MRLLKYPGGKVRLAPQIVKLLLRIEGNENLEYREPFLGGGSVLRQLLISKAVNRIWVNDKYLPLVNLWNMVLDFPKLLCKKVEGVKLTRQTVLKIKEHLFKTNDGPSYMQINRTSFSGLVGKGGFMKDVNARWNPPALCAEIELLNEHLHDVKLRYNRVTCLDYKKLIQDERSKALIYLDPPYYKIGKKLYPESMTDDEHVELAKMLRRTPHKWLLSINDCPEIRELYKWALIEEVIAPYSIRKRKLKVELLITSKK